MLTYANVSLEKPRKMTVVIINKSRRLSAPAIAAIMIDVVQSFIVV